MITHNVEQNSDGWFKLRLGIPTASGFGKIVTSTGKSSTQSGKYMDILLAERMAGERVESWGGNEWTERGHELESEARTYYEMIKGVDVNQAGFITNDEETAGMSPDGLIGEDGGLEIKCPSPGIHVSYLLANKVPAIYIPQIQGSMWLSDRDWWDFMSYHPLIEKMVIRVNRDGKYISVLANAIEKFTDQMLEKQHKLKQLGYTI